MELELLVQDPQDGRHATPLLFVHGAWGAAWCWENFLPYFSALGYPCYAMSLRGHGESGGREHIRTIRVKDYVEDVAQVVRQMPRPPVLIGHSLGGLVVLKYLRDNTLPAAVVLAPVAVGGILPQTLRMMFKRPLLIARVNLTFKTLPLVGTPDLVREMLFSPELDEATLARHQARFGEESYLALLDMNGLDVPRPRKLTTPGFLLGAQNDASFAHDKMEATAKGYGLDYEFVEGIAHHIPLDYRWEAAARCVAEWLESRRLP